MSLGIEPVFSATIIVSFALFFVLSIVNQLALLFGNAKGARSWERLLMQFRVRGRSIYLPVWTFFSWVPDFNLRLLIRDRLDDGQLTPWRAINYVCIPWARCLWNPDRRREKANLQLSAGLLTVLARARDLNPDDIFASRDYRALVDISLGVSPSTISVSRQFMIVKTYFAYDTRPSEICFISPHSSTTPSSQLL